MERARPIITPVTKGTRAQCCLVTEDILLCTVGSTDFRSLSLLDILHKLLMHYCKPIYGISTLECAKFGKLRMRVRLRHDNIKRDLIEMMCACLLFVFL